MSLPKFSFTDDEKTENGGKMLSRFGKMTKYNYPILKGADPIEQHTRFLTNMAKNDPSNIDHEKEALEEERRQNKLKDNSMQTKTDLDGFLKRMN